ncbi:Multidrug resistance ABC transporter ATP-binding and permease [Alteracholeplasma palmae J233]|uniref:Multidrug resistance ABC transporter ATP-binding and permease n=2 Tax=Acholeplasma palmae TaxID=38986 RepID=U4KLZ5_ALTPJ|nr:Multidrug resistance ABC transporter ATP-binding and permease [Alteracholeplasma palmae J233]
MNSKLREEFKMKNLKYVKKHICFFILIIMLTIISSFLLTYPIQVLRELIDGVTSTENFVLENFILYASVYVLCVLFSAISNSLRIYLSSKLKFRIASDIRGEYYDIMLKLKLSFYDNADNGELLGIVMQDSEIIAQGIVSPFSNVSKVIFSLGFGIYFMSQINVLLTLILMPIAILFSIVTSVSSWKLKFYAKENRKRNQVLWNFLSRTLKGIRDIKSFNNEKNYHYSFNNESQNMKDNDIKTERYKFRVELINAIFVFFLICASLIIGGYLVIIGNISLGSMVAFLTHNSMLVAPMSGVVLVFQEVLRSKASLERSRIITEADTDEAYSFNSTIDKDCSHKILRVENLSFSYDSSRTVLSQISFEIEQGTVTAFVGASGSGKSSMIKALSTLYSDKIYNGTITLFDNVIEEKNALFARTILSFAFQDTFLFNGTILDNILFSNPFATKEEIKKALNTACIYEMVSLLPEGLETMIGENGALLSGGERQRIGIARSLLKASEILLFDEATSSLDNKTEKKVMHNLLENYKNKTIILIAHRLSTIIESDCIYVFEKGQIVEKGNHQQLMSEKGKYFGLYTASNKKA